MKPDLRREARTGNQRADPARDRPSTFRALLDRTSDGIQLIEPSTAQFVEVNETSCRTLGYPRSALLQMTWFDVDPGLDVQSYNRMEEQARTTGAFVVARVFRRQDGSTFPVEVDISWIEVDRPYLVAVVRDVSERQRGWIRIRVHVLPAAARSGRAGDGSRA